MRLYLLRHGQSPTAREAGVATDAERPLSDQGRQDLKKTFREVLKKGGRPGLILHSPLRRAKETAEEARKNLSVQAALEPFPLLANQAAPEQVFEALLPVLSDEREVLAVGHQPQLGELIVFLSGPGVDAIVPGGITALDIGKDRKVRRLWNFNP